MAEISRSRSPLRFDDTLRGGGEHSVESSAEVAGGDDVPLEEIADSARSDFGAFAIRKFLAWK